MLQIGPLDSGSEVPIYKQLHEAIRRLIDGGHIQKGGRLPATRELAGQLGLNRATVSAAYELLEADGLIAGHVGRGSFVAGGGARHSGVNWREILGPAAGVSPGAPASTPLASFSSSRPSELLF